MKDIRKFPALIKEFFRQYKLSKQASKIEQKMGQAIKDNDEEKLNEYIEKFLEVYPTSPKNPYYPEDKWAGNIYYNVGTTCAKEKHFELAISMYRIAARYAPSPAVYNNMSTCFKRQEKYYEAYNCLKKAIKKDSNYVSGYGRLAILLEAYNPPVEDDSLRYIQKYFELGGKEESLEKLINKSMPEEKKAIDRLMEKAAG
ncbi:hypothetical protein [Natranaerofaba carboxydovora]|uniref:hypothetical protein n=1 Tax=Natranaerofaba carboxydovora TaxID=2742683 RepID=UPI001F148C74|nr:hypothetical protein [Natranaerofaba carboxydovora]UMZ74827.1 Tetratricopeptide repeat protein [Natranaerofaba carboxydovora]